MMRPQPSRAGRSPLGVFRTIVLAKEDGEESERGIGNQAVDTAA